MDKHQIPYSNFVADEQTIRIVPDVRVNLLMMNTQDKAVFWRSSWDIKHEQILGHPPTDLPRCVQVSLS